MLGKLMKYEFMAMGRVFLPLFGALIAVSIVNRLLALLPQMAPVTIGRVLSGVLIASILVLSLILTFQRFRKNLLSDEGYLMMTLPVSTDSLILSKLFVAAIFYFASMIVVTLSISIMTLTWVSWRELFEFFMDIHIQFVDQPLETIVYIINIFVITTLSTFAGILMLYICMALSMLVNKRRGLFTFGAFIVISTTLQILFAISISIIAILSIEEFFEDLFSLMSDFATIQVVLLIFSMIILALCTVFYFITRHMLKNRLNLQ